MAFTKTQDEISSKVDNLIAEKNSQRQQLNAAIAALQTLNGEIGDLNKIRIRDRLNNIIFRLQRI